MRTAVVLVILLLTIGLAWGPAPALAEGKAVNQPLPLTCQPVSDAELTQISGKFFRFNNNLNFCQVARCVYQKLPLSEETRTSIRNVYQKIQCFRSCFNNINGNETQK